MNKTHISAEPLFNAAPLRVNRPSVSFSLAAATATEAPVDTWSCEEISSPDFYWEFRLNRLAKQKSDALAYSASNYPEAKGFKSQYEAYYLDLTLAGKMDGFDWRKEKELSDSEWLTVYKSICKWSEDTYKKNKPDMSNLPENDFAFLKNFYPQLNMRDLETPFVEDEVGANFPYTNMGELLSAGLKGTLAVPGYDAKSVTSIEASEVSADLAALKESTMNRIDAVYEDAMKFAQNPFPDDEAKAHYKELKGKLANFPQSPEAWSTFRSNMDKEVDEMSRLAATDPKAFEQKYGNQLEEMQARMDKFKSDPEGFMESSIIAKFGASGLDVWKKSQEFSKDMEVMSDADKKAAETAFSSFLSSA